MATLNYTTRVPVARTAGEPYRPPAGAVIREATPAEAKRRSPDVANT